MRGCYNYRVIIKCLLAQLNWVLGSSSTTRIQEWSIYEKIGMGYPYNLLLNHK